MSRPYNKIAPYWENRKQAPKLSESVAPRIDTTRPMVPSISYETYGESIMASCDSGTTTNTRTKGVNGPNINGMNGFDNLWSYPVPYEYSNGRYFMNNTLNLIMRAYVGFPIFRNAIEVLVEFTNTAMHLKGGNAKSRSFIAAWFEKVGMSKLKEQYFREYYRSGNVFLYRFDGKLRDADFSAIKQVQAATSNIVPIRYIVINPTSIFVENAVITNKFTYVKMLSPFEVERLRFPQTDEEKQLFDSLPAIVKTQIKNSSGGGLRQIYVPIDPQRLYFSFYKKQDYEPLAVPMGFGVLNDIEWKLQLKRMDMALTKTIEHAMLIVTTGTDPDKGGVNPLNVQALQDLFKNSTIGRVLVADYTTTAKWVIPDFKELLGPEKYTTVDKDIREGLQSILVGDDKFANAIVKARVFNERLKEGRTAFVRDFLQPEIKRICTEMGFKGAAPTVEFEEVSLEDDTNLQRMYTSWAQLGILAPWELLRAKQTGLLPEKEDNIESQNEYKIYRDSEFYYPLVGASIPASVASVVESPTPNPKTSSGKGGSAGRPAGTKSKQTTKKVSPIGGGVSTLKLISAMKSADILKEAVMASFRENLKIEKLDETTESLALALTKAIMVNEPEPQWKESITSYIKSPKEQDKQFSSEVDEIRIEADIDEMTAILLNKCKIEPKSDEPTV